MLVTGKELDLNILGINNVKEVHRNLSVEQLIKETVANGEGVIGPRGATIVDTGKYTGRSPKDNISLMNQLQQKIFGGEMLIKN